MKARNARLLDEIIDELKLQIGPASMDLGALKSTTDTELVNEKIADSFSGHFVDAAIRAITVKLILFISRSCELNGNTIAKALKILESEASNIEKKRKEDHPDWPEQLLEIGEVAEKIDFAKKELENIEESGVYKRARLARDERYAHLLRGKSDLRSKHADSFEKFDDITFKEVEELALRVLLLLKEIVRIWTFTVEDVEGRVKIAENYSRDFWNALPVLKEVERTK